MPQTRAEGTQGQRQRREEESFLQSHSQSSNTLCPRTTLGVDLEFISPAPAISCSVQNNAKWIKDLYLPPMVGAAYPSNAHCYSPKETRLFKYFYNGCFAMQKLNSTGLWERLGSRFQTDTWRERPRKRWEGLTLPANQMFNWSCACENASTHTHADLATISVCHKAFSRYQCGHKLGEFIRRILCRILALQQFLLSSLHQSRLWFSTDEKSTSRRRDNCHLLHHLCDWTLQSKNLALTLSKKIYKKM